jgi:hypothetical protein
VVVFARQYGILMDYQLEKNAGNTNAYDENQAIKMKGIGCFTLYI